MTRQDLRIVFMGTPAFAVATLDAIVKAGFNVVGVITTPDKPAGRGRQLSSSEVKVYAVENNLKVLQPTNLKDESFIQELKLLKANLQIVVAFRMLPEIVWSMPALGTFNLHASLLPQYRGAAPINRAIMNGEKITGITTFFLEKQIDTGKIIFNERVEIPENMNAGELHDILMEKGSRLVLKTIDAIVQEKVQAVDQQSLIKGNINEAPKIFKPDCKINWNSSVKQVHDHIRGLSPYPAAFTNLKCNNQELEVKIFETNIEYLDNVDTPGSIISDNKSSIKIACNDGLLSVLSLQVSGKKRMTSKEFLNGFKFNNECKAF